MLIQNHKRNSLAFARGLITNESCGSQRSFSSISDVKFQRIAKIQVRIFVGFRFHTLIESEKTHIHSLLILIRFSAHHTNCARSRSNRKTFPFRYDYDFAVFAFFFYFEQFSFISLKAFDCICFDTHLFLCDVFREKKTELTIQIY